MPRASTSTRRLPSPSPPIAAATGTGDASFSFSTDRHSTSRRARPPTSLFESNLSVDQVENLRRQSSLSTLSLSPRRPSVANSGSTATTRPRRGAGATGLAYNTQGDETSYLGEADGEQAPWTMVDRMRNWRNDAMTQHLYDSAKFWGGKVLGLTSEIAALPPIRVRCSLRRITDLPLSPTRPSQTIRTTPSGWRRFTFSPISTRKRNVYSQLYDQRPLRLRRLRRRRQQVA